MPKVNRPNFRDIDLIVYDFDGVMTDNKVYVFQDGREAVKVSRADGLGINMIKKMAIPQLILSTETNSIVSTRAKKLGIDVLQGIDNKKKELEQYCAKKVYTLNNVIYIGNDINDEKAMRLVGFPIAPADAHKQILTMAKLILKNKGGDGVIRELADYLNEKNK